MRLYATSVAAHSGEGCTVDHVAQTDTAQRLSEFVLGNWRTGNTDFGDELRVRLLSSFADGAGGAKNIVCRYAAAAQDPDGDSRGSKREWQGRSCRVRFSAGLMI